MRAVRTTTISILAIGLLAGPSVGVAAQEGDAAAEPGTPTKVTGTIDREAAEFVLAPTETRVDDLLEVRNGRFAGDWFDMDDPRLTGIATVAFNADIHDESDVVGIEVETLAFRIDNEAGSWSGQGTSVSHGGEGIPQEEALGLTTLLLTGAAAYEGHSAYLVADFTEDPPTVEGVIYAGELPPFPELTVE